MRFALPLALLCFAACDNTRAENAAFLDAAAAEPGATRTSSGLVYQDLTVGTGAQPDATNNRVGVHYVGKLIDGSVFDQSGSQTVSFLLTQVIPCWTEGVAMMKQGGTARLVCPPNLAYGSSPPSGIPADAVLDFQVDLVTVSR